MIGIYFVITLHLLVQRVFINTDSNLTALSNQIKTNLKKCFLWIVHFLLPLQYSLAFIDISTLNVK
jgi:hypothetical protein